MPLFNSPRWNRCLQITCMTLVLSVMLRSFQLPVQVQGKERPMGHPTFYRTIQIDGLSIFYREAGLKDAPTLLLLHGVPSSSRMFEPLFVRLSDRYRGMLLCSSSLPSLGLERIQLHIEREGFVPTGHDFRRSFSTSSRCRGGERNRFLFSASLAMSDMPTHSRKTTRLPNGFP